MPTRGVAYPHHFPGTGDWAAMAESVLELRHLPPAQALARLGYALKRPVFALPFYGLSLPRTAPLALVLTPSDAWPGDAKLGAELLQDRFAGRAVAASGVRAAQADAESGRLAAWHSFAWLRDLRAVGGDAARRRARELVAAWLAAHDTWSALPWEPLAIGRRLSHWLGCYEFFAASAEIAFRHRLHGSMARQARHLSRVLPGGLAGADLIAALKGLITAGVCLPDGDDWRQHGLALLRRELVRQVLADGVHVERNPARHMAVLRDLIDLRAVLRKGEALAGGGVPGELQAAVEAMAPALSLFRHGDGALAAFNGGGEEESWHVDMVLQRATGQVQAKPQGRDNGFQRLCAGRTLVLVDGGAPPPPGLDSAAHAGTLSLEVSIGRERLIVNCGSRPGDRVWRWAQRTTAAHSTLVVGDSNSSALLDKGGLGRRAQIGHCRRAEADGNQWLDVSHDGYRRSHGLRHHRRLYLAADGMDLRGEDRLEPHRPSPARDFALRFHLHPDVRASLAHSGESVLLRLAKGGGWQLRARGARVSLEPSVYLCRRGEIKRSQQIVFSGRTDGSGACIKWALRRLARQRR